MQEEQQNFLTNLMWSERRRGWVGESRVTPKAVASAAGGKRFRQLKWDRLQVKERQGVISSSKPNYSSRPKSSCLQTRDGLVSSSRHCCHHRPGAPSLSPGAAAPFTLCPEALESPGTMRGGAPCSLLSPPKPASLLPLK